MKKINVSSEVEKRCDHLWQKNSKNEEYHHKRAIEAQNVLNELNCPVEPGTFVGLKYDSKTDRYVMSFEASGKSHSFKVSDEVADFVAQEIKTPGYWRLRVEKGCVVDAVLISYI